MRSLQVVDAGSLAGASAAKDKDNDSAAGGPSSWRAARDDAEERERRREEKEVPRQVRLHAVCVFPGICVVLLSAYSFSPPPLHTHTNLPLDPLIS